MKLYLPEDFLGKSTGVGEFGGGNKTQVGSVQLERILVLVLFMCPFFQDQDQGGEKCVGGGEVQIDLSVKLEVIS